MWKDNEISATTALSVTLFNYFQISVGSSVIDERDIRSDMVTKLLAYIICHRDANISLQELTKVLWGDTELDNPAGALKNLMYRARNILKKFIGDYRFIITGRGFYKWNDQIRVVVDVEEFEKAYKLSEEEKRLDRRIDLGLKAISYYTERFLPQYTDEYWIVSLNVYYHSMYIDMVKRLAADMEEAGRFFDMEELCHSAIRIDELDENLHYYLIRALIRQNKHNIATEHYKKACNLLYDKLGVRPSEKLQGIYDKLLEQKHSMQRDISLIQKELFSGGSVKTGAFVCEYGVFKKNFELEIRRAKRNGVGVHLVLITINPEVAFQPGTVAYNNIIGLGIKQMQDVLMTSLRAGDVVTRYSVEQFIIMLPQCSSENAAQVMARVMDNYQGLSRKARIKVEYCMEEVQME